ncbi:hypothetical protein HanIR_Chr16g0835091 [Helianthus annuus]|nr:hypothetical protein HanIR_Chr16g0835091 [Helianthus annuus]
MAVEIDACGSAVPFRAAPSPSTPTFIADPQFYYVCISYFKHMLVIISCGVGSSQILNGLVEALFDVLNISELFSKTLKRI